MLLNPASAPSITYIAAPTRLTTTSTAMRNTAIPIRAGTQRVDEEPFAAHELRQLQDPEHAQDAQEADDGERLPARDEEADEAGEDREQVDDAEEGARVPGRTLRRD